MKKKILKKEKKLIKYEMLHFDNIIYAIIGLVGVILFWKGLVNIITDMEKVQPLHPLALILAGFVIMMLTGYLIRR